ncbi:MAG: AMP-binding enzyme, partial [Pseudomonas sp.]
GFNVYPSEIEDVLMTHVGVRVAAAIGVPDARSGEAIRLFIVPHAGQTLDASEVQHFLRARLTAYKVPKHIEFREHLPTSTVGKILRRELRAEVLAAGN